MDWEHSTPCGTPPEWPRAHSDSNDSDISASESISESDSEESVRATDMSPLDTKERVGISSFINESCGCTLGPSKQPVH